MVEDGGVNFLLCFTGVVSLVVWGGSGVVVDAVVDAIDAGAGAGAGAVGFDGETALKSLFAIPIWGTRRF